jgi:hypothetical protein
MIVEGLKADDWDVICANITTAFLKEISLKTWFGEEEGN